MEAEIEEILRKLEVWEAICVKETYALSDDLQSLHQTIGRVTVEWVLSYLDQLKKDGEIKILLPNGFVKHIVKLEVARSVEWEGKIIDKEPRRDVKPVQENTSLVVQQLSLF